jgi:hypothetical protein
MFTYETLKALTHISPSARGDANLRGAVPSWNYPSEKTRREFLTKVHLNEIRVYIIQVIHTELCGVD